VLPPPLQSNPIVAARTLPAIKMTEARWYRVGPRRKRTIWIVLHCTDGVEGPRKAEDGAHELANIPVGAKRRSCHWIVDTDSIVQCVPVECEAFHAGRNANMFGEGIEICGRASQTHEQWLDALSLPMLQLAARLVRVRADALGIPLRFLRGPELRANIPGLTTHMEITRAFPHDTDHTDPGAGFPLAEFLAAAQEATP
jgi:N-acetylmuramoyl-L-alanine amidase